MKIDILFALPGPQNAVQGDKLLVVAAATEHEDPQYLTGIVADVAETAIEAGAYRTVRKITLELDDRLVLALLQGEAAPAAGLLPQATVHRAMLH
ncbi:MAG: hypothetical protein IPK66_04525 [Rhodospirillales bacterium]|nr:hypothetical protein [Rhodospirillales bacterium]